MEFYELNIWKKGYELLLEVYKITLNFPHEEKYGLTDQVRRSSNSVIANIAEAFGRYSFTDKIRVLYQARGEAEEVRSHLRVALGLNFIQNEMYSKLDKEYKGLSVGINAYIQSLKRNK